MERDTKLRGSSKTLLNLLIHDNIRGYLHMDELTNVCKFLDEHITSIVFETKIECLDRLASILTSERFGLEKHHDFDNVDIFAELSFVNDIKKKIIEDAVKRDLIKIFDYKYEPGRFTLDDIGRLIVIETAEQYVYMTGVEFLNAIHPIIVINPSSDSLEGAINWRNCKSEVIETTANLFNDTLYTRVKGLLDEVREIIYHRKQEKPDSDNQDNPSNSY